MVWSSSVVIRPLDLATSLASSGDPQTHRTAPATQNLRNMSSSTALCAQGAGTSKQCALPGLLRLVLPTQARRWERGCSWYGDLEPEWCDRSLRRGQLQVKLFPWRALRPYTPGLGAVALRPALATSEARCGQSPGPRRNYYHCATLGAQRLTESQLSGAMKRHY